MTTPLILPPNLAGLSKFTNSQTTKYAVSGVQVNATDVEGGYKVVATDCTRVVIVEGVPATTTTDVIPAMVDAPNGATSAIIPAKTFNKVLTAAGKQVYSRFQQTQVVLSKEVTTLGNTDLDATNVEQTKNVEGRYPPIDEVMPKGEPIAKVSVDGKKAAEILTYLAKISTVVSDAGRVDLEIHKGMILVFKSQGTDQKATALLMGLS